MNDIESVPCDVCGSFDSTEIVSQRDLAFAVTGDLFHVMECNHCHLMYTNPRPDQKKLPDFYVNTYYNLPEQALEKSDSKNLKPKFKDRFRVLLKEELYHYPKSSPQKRNGIKHFLLILMLRIEQFRLVLAGREKGIIPFIGEGKVLDVGCGNGVILKGLQSEGWKTYGVELNDRASDYARRILGLNVFTGALMDAKFPDSFFDVILFNHTLEHMTSPRRVLAEANRILKAGGLLVISLPNARSIEARLFKSYWFPWELPRHLYHFSFSTLTKILKLNGFKVSKMVGETGTGTFLKSFEYVCRYKFGRKCDAVINKMVRPLIRPFLFIFGHLGLSGIFTVYARKE